MPNAGITNALTLPNVDIANTTSTTGVLALGTSVYGSLSTGADSDWYRVTLVAGQTYDIRLLGVGTTPVDNTFMVLRDAAGGVLAQNNDAANGGGAFGSNSGLTFKATTTGNYFVDAQAFGGIGSGGNFLLSAVAHDASGLVLTPDEIAWQLTNNFERFTSSAGTSNIPATSYDLSGGRTITYNVTLMSVQAQTLALRALQMWADVTGINFVATAGAAQISFDDSDAGSNAYESNLSQINGTITSSSVMVTTGWFAEFGTTMNCYSFETMIHEVGHALGLGHGGNYNGTADYGIDNYYLNDSQHMSIMSYMQAAYDEFSTGVTDSNTFVNAQFRYVLSPMIADIIAMQNLYGASTNTRTGNTTYGYNSNTGNAALDAAVTLNDAAHNNYVAFTIFDNGGNDTVDLSGFAGAQRIDLNQGASSDVLGGRLNMGIAFGTQVENAIGGSGADVITGNAADNALNGRNGTDQLFGGAGNDALDGGTGADRMDGGAGNDLFYVDDSADVIIEAAANGTADQVVSFGNYTLTAGAEVEVLRLTDASLTYAFNLAGNGTSQSISGNAGANALYGLSGNDSLYGFAGNDSLDGGRGADLMDGGAGNDLFYVDDGADVIVEAAANGTADQVVSAGHYTLTAGAEVEILRLANAALTTAFNLAGNGTSQSISGNAGANALYGLSGNDSLYGFAGNDSLDGGRGNDLIDGGAGNDQLSGGVGDDTFVFNTALGAQNIDTVTDYNILNDSIQLDHTFFATLAVGALAEANFAANETGLALRTTDRIILETDTGRLFYDADGLGGADGVQFASLVIVGSNLIGFNQAEFAII